LAVDIALVVLGGEIGGVAFHAARADGPVEDRLAIGVAGAVDPLAAGGPIRNRQLVEPIVFPIQIGLADFARAGDDFHPLAVLVQLVVFAPDIGRLVKFVVAGAHFKPQLIVARPHERGITGEVASNGLRIGESRCDVVRRLDKALVFVRVAVLAGGGADIGGGAGNLLAGL